MIPYVREESKITPQHNHRTIALRLHLPDQVFIAPASSSRRRRRRRNFEVI
jgi:hypothetical protein